MFLVCAGLSVVLKSCESALVSLVCVYICMVITYSQNKDQPGKVANPACGQLNKGNKYFPVPLRT